ncbi:hypothetical protein [Goekera deserti]|uniref:Uncharacterized protein n=1 Tax=Goekera deserti TaxID=2497753 RepID=A0A7K3WE48_9ACTN|nr:hypothetical protein [Goekera deserti]NDI49020.1 hypothetical protein [Goekera deserti]NEL54189.1 hypothetical protein [Goekera deserti]
MLIWSIAGGVALVAVIVTLVVLFTGSGGPEPTPAATREPTGLGDDPVLDELARSCYDGDMGACDDLYLESEFDSAYERYGDTCAGRKDAGTWSLCTDDFEDAPAGGGR